MILVLFVQLIQIKSELDFCSDHNTFVLDNTNLI